MAKFQHKPNSGTLFPNDRKRPDKKDADLRGDALIEGQEYYLDAWKNEGGRINVKFKLKGAPTSRPSNEPDSDSPPF